MEETVVLIASYDVDSRLASLGVDRDFVIRVAIQAVMARNESVSIDPCNAPGQLAYIYGVREIRKSLLQKGWREDRTDNIEGTINPVTGVKILYQNVDQACAPREPKAISGKGTAVERMINATPFLFKEMEDEYLQHANVGAWFLCVSVDKDDRIRAELSRPLTIEKNQFGIFAERIFVLNDDLFNGGERDDEDRDDSSDDYEVTVTRKK